MVRFIFSSKKNRNNYFKTLKGALNHLSYPQNANHHQFNMQYMQQQPHNISSQQYMPQQSNQQMISPLMQYNQQIQQSIPIHHQQPVAQQTELNNQIVQNIINKNTETPLKSNFKHLMNLFTVFNSHIFKTIQFK